MHGASEFNSDLGPIKIPTAEDLYESRTYTTAIGSKVDQRCRITPEATQTAIGAARMVGYAPKRIITLLQSSYD